MAASLNATLWAYPPRQDRNRMWPLGWTVSKAGLASVIDVVNDAAQLARGLFLVLLPHVRRHLQVVRHLGVVVGLLLVAAPPVLEQFAPGLAQLAENRPQRVQAFLDRCVCRWDGAQVLGHLPWCPAAVRKLSGTTWI